MMMTPYQGIAEPVNGRDHVQGSDDAPVTLLIYADFQCLQCGRAYAMLKELVEELPGTFRLAFRHFPLTSVHPHAGIAAKAAEAAARQGRFWEMHDTLFANQRFLDADALRDYAEDIGLDLVQFERDVVDPEIAARVERHILSGRESGVSSTPTFFLNGRMSHDTWDLGALRTAILVAAAAAAGPSISSAR
jgi:formate-nitrite transporter family protein